MREPLPRDETNVTASDPAPAVEMPAPEASALTPGQHRPAAHSSKPTSRFIADLAQAIRAGARPTAAAEWLGIPKRTYRAWLRRQGEPYDTLRAERAKALAHLEVRLTSEIAKKNPAQALRALRDERDTPRTYTKSGLHAVTRALPYLIERVVDASIPDDALTPVEQAARQWRDEVVRDLGGVTNISAARMALLNAATGSMILMSSIDAFVFRLAGENGLVSRKHRKVFPVIEQRMRVADSLVRQLQTIGLDRQKASPTDLNSYIAERYGNASSEPETEQEAPQ
jgi:hypothetical protein